MKKWMMKTLKIISILLITLIIITPYGLSYYLFDYNEKLMKKNENLYIKIDSTKNELKNLNLKFKMLGLETETHKKSLKILEERDREIRKNVLFFTDLDLYEFQNELKSIDEICKSSPDIIQKNLDYLGRRIKIQSNKYDSLQLMVKENISFLLSIPLIKPIQSKDIYTFSSKYGYRSDPMNHTLKFHEGIDIAANKNTSVVSTGWGYVEEVVWSKYGYGNRILINHGYGYKSFYAHLNITYVKRGQQVRRGQIIGRVGSSGKSTGPHLHYEIYKNGVHIDPMNHFYSYNTRKTKKFKKLLILKK